MKSLIYGSRIGMLLSAAFLVAAAPLFAPQLLAFQYKMETAIGTVYSVERIEPQTLTTAAHHASARMATSPLAQMPETRPVFLTAGRWRWKWLSISQQGAFALSRPLTKAVIVNRTEPQTAVVRNGEAVGGKRQLAGILAHEFTHGMIRRRYGLLNAQRFPVWKTEGYCDHVAGESSLSAADIARLQARGENHPAVPYYHGRKRVEAILNENGGSVDRLFSGDR